MKSLTYSMVTMVLVATAGGVFLSIPPKPAPSVRFEHSRANGAEPASTDGLAQLEAELATPESMQAAHDEREMLQSVAIETARLDAIQKAMRAQMKVEADGRAK